MNTPAFFSTLALSLKCRKASSSRLAVSTAARDILNDLAKLGHRLSHPRKVKVQAIPFHANECRADTQAERDRLLNPGNAFQMSKSERSTNGEMTSHRDLGSRRKDSNAGMSILRF